VVGKLDVFAKYRHTRKYKSSPFGSAERYKQPLPCPLPGSTVLQCEGSKAAAERLYWLALAVGERALGPEHLDTLAIMSNLAITTLMLGRHAEAKEIYRQQLERGVKAFGWDHPKTYSAKFNLNSLLDENEEIRVSDNVDIMRNGKATVEIRRK
jgi:hypothetical protein